ncbi:MAG: hypothetical protein J6K48_12145 [Lachnospiraceae bacterium]|nr:hypothetical protein [Lachnospiraceae bacterium]
MNQKPNTSLKKAKSKRHCVNWHEAAICALKIDLRDYNHFLEFQSEYILGKNSYRIDLLIIKKLNKQPIPKNIAHIFRTYNLFEIKGMGTFLSTDSYYKTIGYAGLFINQTGKKNQYTSLDISLTFLSMHYPRRLMKHLQKERNLIVEKYSPGVYYVIKEIFNIQIIVIKELLPEEYLYLHCLTDKLHDSKLIAQLADDYKIHQDQDIYIKYLHQLTTANTRKKGDSLMVCEGLLNLFGTSSEEIIERTKQEDAEYYLPQIDYLKDLLRKNNIPFDLPSRQ